MSGRIVINARYQYRRITGVERYAGEVSAHLGNKLTRIVPGRFLGPVGGHIWEQMVLPRRIHPRDVLWSPANTGPISLPNQVLNLHDLSVIDHPEWFASPFALWYAILLKNLVPRVRAIITPSFHEKIRIEDAFRIGAEKIFVVPPGVDRGRFYPITDAQKPTCLKCLQARFNIPERFILSVGSLQPRKNLTGLLKAFKVLQQASPETGLVIIGSTGAAFARQNLPDQLSGVQFLGYVTDRELNAFYNLAAVFVMASWREGFGLPVLEAMSCGTPVISSAAGGLAEAVGEAALRIDPGRPGEMAAAISRVLGDESLRQSLRESGLQHASQFSWASTASKIDQILTAVL